MRHDFTISEIAKTLKDRGQVMALSHSNEQYHVYVIRGACVTRYVRDDDFDVAIGEALKQQPESGNEQSTADADPR